MASSFSSSSSLFLGPHTILTPRLSIRTPSAADIPSLLDHFTNPAATTEPQPSLTKDALQQRLAKWDRTRQEGTNAWLIACLHGGSNGSSHDEQGAAAAVGDKDKDKDDEESKVIGFGGFNSFPRTRMMNSAERTSDAVSEEEKVTCADIGVGIDAREHRKGYAREAICAMVEYAFGTLHCGYVHVDTQHENTAFRALMRDLGIPEREGAGVEHEDRVFGFAWKSVNYDFDEKMWAEVRNGLKTRGKWPL